MLQALIATILVAKTVRPRAATKRILRDCPRSRQIPRVTLLAEQKCHTPAAALVPIGHFSHFGALQGFFAGLR